MGIFTGRKAAPILRIALLVVLLPLGTVSAHHRRAAFPTFTRVVVDPNPGNVPVEK